MILQEILRQAMQKVDLDFNADTLSRTKGINFLNERYIRTYRAYPWRDSIRSTTLALTEGVVNYALDEQVDEIIRFYDFARGVNLDQHTIEEWLTFIAELEAVTGSETTGQPSDYRELYETTSREAMTIDDTVEIVSSSAADTSANCVRISGEVDGIELAEDITLTGTSAVTSTNTYDSGSLLHITTGTTDGTEKSIVGTVTVRESTTTANIKAKIAPADSETWYKWIAISPEPKASPNDVTIYYRRRIRPLLSFNDSPIIDMGDVLVQGVYADFLKLDGRGNEAVTEEQIFLNLTKELYSRKGRKKNLDLQFRPRRDTASATRFARTRYPYFH